MPARVAKSSSGDVGEEPGEQMLDADGQREVLLPRGVVALPRRVLGHLGLRAAFGDDGMLAGGSRGRKWTSARFGVGHRRFGTYEIRPVRPKRSMTAIGISAGC